MKNIEHLVYTFEFKDGTHEDHVDYTLASPTYFNSVMEHRDLGRVIAALDNFVLSHVNVSAPVLLKLLYNGREYIGHEATTFREDADVFESLNTILDYGFFAGVFTELSEGFMKEFAMSSAATASILVTVEDLAVTMKNLLLYHGPSHNIQTLLEYHSPLVR